MAGLDLPLSGVPTSAVAGHLLAGIRSQTGAINSDSGSGSSSNCSDASSSITLLRSIIKSIGVSSERLNSRDTTPAAMPTTTTRTTAAATLSSSTLPLLSLSNGSSSSAATTTTTATTAANSSASASPSSSAPSPVPHSLFAAVRALELATAASTRGTTFSAPCNCFSPLTPQRTHDIHAWLHGRAWPSSSPSLSSFSSSTRSAATPPSFSHDEDDDGDDGSIDSASNDDDDDDFDHRRHVLPPSIHTPPPIIPCRRSRSPHHSPLHHHHHRHHHLHSPLPRRRCTDACQGCAVALAETVCRDLLELDEHLVGPLLAQLSKTVFPEVCRRAWAGPNLVAIPISSSSSSSESSNSDGSSHSSTTAPAPGDASLTSAAAADTLATADALPAAAAAAAAAPAVKVLVQGADDEEGFDMLLRLLAACAEPLQSRAHLVSVLARRFRRCLLALVTMARAAGDAVLAAELEKLVYELDGSDLITCRGSKEQMRLVRRLVTDIWEVRRDRWRMGVGSGGVGVGGCGYFL